MNKKGENNSYEFIVVKDDDKTKEAHVKLGGKIFMRAVRDKTTNTVQIRGEKGAFNFDLDDLIQLKKDMKKAFKPVKKSS